jgi:molybdopterin molybdotransferase
MQENAPPDGAGGILVSAPVNRGENYVRRGEDIRKGQRLAAEGTRLNFASLGVLASMGLRDVSVRRLPAVGLLCTGDELVKAGVPLPAGKIYGSNETLLEARLRELGFTPAVLGVGADDAGAVASKIEAAIGGLDALITTGAVSVGEKDIFHEVFALLGAERLFWRMNTKPGGAMLCGIYRGKPLLCLSGNPFAALTGFEVIARPVLDRLSGGRGAAARQRVRSGEDIEAKGVRRFMRARTGNGEACLGDSHLSGQLFSLAGCNCLLDVPANTTVRAGDELDALMF